MWEGLVQSPRGRISARKFITLFATLLVACFVYSFSQAIPAFAATSASWSGNTISYENNTYAPFTPTSGDGLSSGTTYYKFGPRPGSNVAKFIEFSSGTTPQTATSATLQNFVLSGNDYSQPSRLQPITITPAGQSSGDAASAGTTSCAVDGIGWIVCPISNFLAKGMDLIYGYIQSFLVVQPLATTQNNAMYRAWSYMRNFANIGFVIGFMVVIYSQLTSLGLSNYSVKKILPRFIIAAILVNISYWICAAAVDVFNILGYSVQDLFIQVRNSLVGSEGNSWHVISWQSMTSLILGGGSGLAGIGIAGYLGITTAATIAVTAGVSGLIILLLPMLLGLLFVILMTFLILAARQAIITILIVLAPLAFVAYLLPNTEKWFNRWRDTFVTLLFVFPAFSAVYAGAQLAASVIIQNATNINTILLAMAVQIAPLAITPLLLKLGGGVLGRFAGIVNNPTKGVFDRGKNWARGRTEQNMSAGNARLAQMRKAARGLGMDGLVKVDKDGNAILDAAGNPVKHHKRPLHPYNMAHNREYDKRRREGLKSAHDAMSDGLFTQTRAGEAIDHLNKDAHGEKHAGEAANTRRYNTAMHAGATVQDRYRRDLHHQAHINEGVGKLYEEALTNHAERDLQAQINNPAGALRNVKIHANVDASHAKLNVDEVEGASRRAFQMEFDGSTAAAKALRQQRYRIIEDNKVADTIEKTVTTRGESRWQRISSDMTDPHFDQALRTLRLKEENAGGALKEAEANYNQLIASIKRDGSRGLTIAAPSDITIANQIQGSTQSIITADAATAKLNEEVNSRAETSFIRSAQGRRLSTQAQAAKDILESTKAEEDALVQEWRTEKGAEGLTGDEARIAQELHEADIQKRAQTQRAASAGSIANQEYAQKVTKDEQIPGGTDSIAEVAGGIAGEAGISQAKATAKQVTFDAFDKAVSAEKTLVSRNTPAQILGAGIPDPSNPSAPAAIGLGSPDILDEPEERIAALAGKVASGSHHESHIKLWERMGELRRQTQAELSTAEASGDQAAIDKAKDRVGKVKSLEQQVMGDKKKIPFGVGDSDQGSAGVGDYAGNVYESTRARISTHMSAQQLASMDPDDIRLIFEMARAGKLSAAELAKVNDAYDAWKADPNLQSSIQDKHRTLLDPIQRHVEGDNNSYPQASDGDFWEGKYDKGLSTLSNH